MPHNHQIQVRAEAKSRPWVDLAPILESLLPVRFFFSGEQRTEPVGEITTDEKASNGNLSSINIPQAPAGSPSAELKETAIYFTNDANVPFPYRGRSVRSRVAAEPKPLVLSANEKILASSDSGPVWTVSSKGNAKHFRSSFVLPEIPADGNLHDVLNGERFLEMLPLLHWLRELCAQNSYEGPPLRACFIFDDPNLHWPSYGFVDYQEVAEHAARENYHVSFATVPLDAWYIHGATAELFRKYAGRLSLTVHGNDHTKKELAARYTQPARVALLKQAIQRMEGLERRTGLQVSRVMVPPHGACSDEMLENLPGCGFESACISHGSLRAHNRGKPWTKTLGYLPSEVIHGCPVMPRWGLTGNTTNTILLAAFLKQPLVIRGHHQDLRGGIELLDQLARIINSLGNVYWSNMSDLSRMNYVQRTEAGTLRVKPSARKVLVQLPKDTANVVIEDTSWDKWRMTHGKGVIPSIGVGEITTLPEGSNGTVLIEAISESAASAEENFKRPVARAFVRRLLAEGRDRVLPWVQTA